MTTQAENRNEVTVIANRSPEAAQRRQEKFNRKDLINALWDAAGAELRKGNRSTAALFLDKASKILANLNRNSFDS